MLRSNLSDFDELFRREYDVIVRDVFLITGQRATATEVTQDAFAEAVAKWRRIRRLDRPGAWVRRVAIRRAVKVRERDRRRDQLAIKDWAQTRLTLDGPDAGTAIDIARALDTLSPMQRALVVLHYFDDLPVAEAAELVGCKPATASVHLHRARQNLGAQLDRKAHADV